MKLEEIVKALKDAEIDTSVISAVEGLDNSERIVELETELKDEKGKAQGILDGKHKYKDRAEKAETELQKIKDEGLSEDEKTQQRIEKLEQELTNEREARSNEKLEIAKAAREAKEADITASIKWDKNVPHDSTKLIVKQALSAYSDEDLTEDNIKTAVTAITESHASFITGDAPKGSGSGNGDVKGNGEKKVFTLEDGVNDAWENN